jgi:N-acylneuraminate cytidylyltransferase
VLGVIPARGGSKGFPGKNLALLAGIPLIAHTIRAARASALLTDTIVSTDDPDIAEAARAHGGNVPFLRPSELATDDCPVWPAVRHAAEHWERARRQPLDLVVLLQPTSPLRTGDDIDRCVAQLRALGAELCASAVVPHDSPYFNMVEVTPESDPFARPCSPRMRSNQRRQDAPTVYALNGAVYAVTRDALSRLENQFRLERFAVYEMPRERSVDIDAPADLDRAEWLLRLASRPPGDEAARSLREEGEVRRG